MSHPDGSRVNTGGRSIPRESGPPVAHEMQYEPGIARDGNDQPIAAIIAACACGGYRLAMTERYYTLGQLTRLAVMHETGSAP